MGEREGVIYALHSGDFKFRYVGQTIRSAHRRLIEHRHAGKMITRGYPVEYWINSIGAESLYVFTLENNLPKSLLNDREVYWIAQLRAEGFDLLNQWDGGNTVPTGKRNHWFGRKHTQDERAKISKANSGSGHWAYGKKFSPEHRAKLGSPGSSNPNSKLSPEDVQDIRRRIALGEKQKDIAEDYGVYQTTISKIKLGVTHKDG